MTEQYQMNADQNGLKAHYEKKYSLEESFGTPLPVERKRFPRNRVEAAIKFMPDHFSKGSILELGAGDGSVAFNLLGQIPGISEYVLSDLSSARLKGVQRNLQDPRVSILELNAENIPESEFGKYDAVLMVALIEHLVDPMRAMQKICKLLRPGGFIYIDTPNIAKYTRRLKLFVGRFPSTASTEEGLTTYQGEPVDLYDEGHLHYFTYASISRMLLRRCGFKRVKKLGYSVGTPYLGQVVHGILAEKWPEMFSELALIAYV